MFYRCSSARKQTPSLQIKSNQNKTTQLIHTQANRSLIPTIKAVDGGEDDGASEDLVNGGISSGMVEDVVEREGGGRGGGIRGAKGAVEGNAVVI